MPRLTRAGPKVAFALIAVSLIGCEEQNTYVEPPPPKVTIAQPLVQDVVDYVEFTGTTVASAQVEVPARVSGILQSVHFEPGTEVTEGELLMEIDPDVYEADVQVAKAELASAEARLSESKKTLERAETLAKKGNVSQAKLDEAEADSRAAAADVLVRQAKLRQAEINLEYTHVTAPISGRVGRNLVDPGNLVGDGEATILTEVTDYDPMFIYFNLNERDLLRIMDMYRARLEAKGIDPNKDPAADADLILEAGLANEEGFPHEGVMDFAESGVDAETGTLQLRGRFKNTGRPPKLLPGLFVRIRMPINERSDLPLVSERAIGSDQSGLYLLVVDGDNKVDKRNIEIGQRIDALTVVEKGLEGGEWVIVNGLQRARPGGPVDPEKVEMASFRISATQEAAKSQPEAAEPSAEGGEDPGAAETQ
ncbi:MAG: efflux RND transporter periplasmic adaptor subunit [Pseudomonadota bacterium]